jgi:hypothetical protein
VHSAFSRTVFGSRPCCRVDAAPPDDTSLREILADIVPDDKRAAEVIRRLRAPVSKGDDVILPLCRERPP